MKIGVIVIGLMILLASTAVVMGMGDPSRLFIEGNKVMILHYDGNYTIELTGPIGSVNQYTSVYEGVVGRDTGKAKLFTVVFSDDVPGTDNPTGDIYFEYDSDGDESIDAPFVLDQQFKANIDIEGVRIITDGIIEIIEEEVEE